MLTNRDYKTMLEAGVDAGLLAIVESAFKVLFEAGAKTLANPMKALPLDSVVDALGIDISDCTSEDGKVNWNSVSRKLYDDSRFMAIELKVNAIVRRALDITGLKFVDESGSPEYAYPGLNKNAELDNIEENLKNGLKYAFALKYRDIDDPQRFTAIINGISVEGAARRLSDTYLCDIKNEVVRTREINLSNHDMDDSDDTVSRYLEREAPYSNGDMYTDDVSLVSENEDGTRWVLDGTDYCMVRGVRAYIELVVLSFNEGTELFEGLEIYTSDRVELPTDSVIVHNIVNLYTKLSAEGKVRGMGFQRGTDNRERVARSNINPYSYIAQNISVKDVVRLIKCEDGVAYRIYELGSVAHETLTLDDIHGLHFFVECVDAGLLDADDLLEWAEHVDEPDWIMSNVDPTMLMLAKQNDPMLFSGRKNSAGTIERLFKHLMAYSDEVIPALTGSSPSRSKQRIDTSVVSDLLDVDNMSAAHLNANLLKNPRIQVEILKHTTPFYFLADLKNTIIRQRVYIPLSTEAVNYMLMNADDEQSRREVSHNLINYYENLVYDVTDLKGFGTRTIRMMFDEVNRNIDDRVRSSGEAGNDLVPLINLAKRVPGFEMPEKSYDEIGPYRGPDAYKDMRGTISTRHLLRILGRLENQGKPKIDRFNKFMELCLSENIRKDYEDRTPAGKRLRTFFMSFAAEEPSLADGEKGTPGDIRKLIPLESTNLVNYFGHNDNEIAKFFSTYLNGKDAEVSRLYTVKSEHVAFARAGIIARLLNSFDRVYSADEALAISAFFSPKGGILRCTSTEYVEVPGMSGKKGNRRPVQKNELMVRLVIASGLSQNITLDEDSFDNKSFIYVVNECLAGQHLILAPEAIASDMIGELLYLSGYYDSYRNNDEEGAEENAKYIVGLDDLDTLIKNNPGVLLKYIHSMPPLMAQKLCRSYFTPENVRNMGRTKEGLKLFLDIAELGNMGDADWRNFAAAFAAGNANNIKNLIKTLPAEEGNRLMEKLAPYINAANNTANSKFTAVSGSELSSQIGSTVQYSMANGLRWMKGYVTTGKPAAMSEDGKAGLYSMEDAMAMFGSVTDGWRLPTADEILHLGDNPDTISEESLGFTSTGMADAEGELISGSDDFCFAWCMGKNGIVGYSVDSNNVIELEDSNIEPEFKLAIKLVR